MDKVAICDHTFLDHTKSASIGGGNIGVGPTHFEWEYADAQTARFVTDGDIKHARGKGQVAWLLEPFGLHPENYLDAMKKDFDTVLMHSHHGHFGALWYPYGGSWIPFDMWGKYEKKKNISMIVSDKNSTKGHLLRKEAEVELRNCGVDFWTNFPDKFDAIAPYKYSIIIESENEPWYFSEKLIDCLSVGTIPIYWGQAPPSFFDLRGMLYFDSVEHLKRIVSSINNEIFNYAFSEDNVSCCRQYAICEDWIFEHYPELFA